MVAVVVRDDGNLGSIGADVHLRHVLEENVSLGPGVEQDRLLGARDEATEAPIGRESFLSRVVVVEHLDGDGRSLFGENPLASDHGQHNRSKPTKPLAHSYDLYPRA